MKKTLLILSLFCASSLGASAATVWYDFNSSNKDNVVGGKSDAMLFATDGDVVASTVKVGLSLTADNSATTVLSAGGQRDWSTVTTSELTTWRNSSASTLVATTAKAPIDDAWKTFIGGSTKSTNFTVTISGLTAGQAYGVYVISGTPWEQAGKWNALELSNAGTKLTSTDNTGWTNWGGESLKVSVPNNLGATNVTANAEGKIEMTFVNKGNSHTMAINALAITGVADAVPEPATASLGLLGLAALMLRRRRA